MEFEPQAYRCKFDRCQKVALRFLIPRCDAAGRGFDALEEAFDFVAFLIDSLSKSLGNLRFDLGGITSIAPCSQIISRIQSA